MHTPQSYYTTDTSLPASVVQWFAPLDAERLPWVRIPPGQPLGNSLSCSSFLFGLVDKVGPWGILGSVSCGNLVVTHAFFPLGNGLLPTRSSRVKETEMTAEAKRIYTV